MHYAHITTVCSQIFAQMRTYNFDVHLECLNVCRARTNLSALVHCPTQCTYGVQSVFWKEEERLCAPKAFSPPYTHHTTHTTHTAHHTTHTNITHIQHIVDWLAHIAHSWRPHTLTLQSLKNLSKQQSSSKAQGAAATPPMRGSDSDSCRAAPCYRRAI